MNVLIAPDKFKGCLSAEGAARLMARGVRRAFPAARIRRIPLADGGDGTAAALRAAWDGRLQRTAVAGPRGGRVRAAWVWFPGTKTALIELAQASGLALLPLPRRNPLKTTTYGTGQLIRTALDRGARRIQVALGGSATVDGGLGMLMALGAQVFLKEGSALAVPGAGEHLSRIDRLDLSGVDPRLKKSWITLLCDVDNRLLGRRGAARAFGPQKGASTKEVDRLGRGLRRWAAILRNATGRDAAREPRMGAAGGAAAGLYAALGAEAVSGAGAVMDAAGFDENLRWADVVVTGEGALDRTSLEGKVVGEVLRRAGRVRRLVFILAGRWGSGAGAVRRKAAASGLVVPGASVRASMEKTARCLPSAAERLVRIFVNSPKGRSGRV